MVCNYSGLVFEVAKNNLVGPAGSLQIFEAGFFIVVRGGAFDCFYGAIARNDDDNFLSVRSGLFKDIFVAGMEIVEGSKEHYCFFGRFHSAGVMFGMKMLIYMRARRMMTVSAI